MRSPFEFDELQEAVNQTVLSGSSDLGEMALDYLERQVFLLQELFVDNPSMAVTGELFEIAERLAQNGLQLATHFQTLPEIEQEERSWHLRYAALLVARAHQRNVTGPALLDWADCHRRMGRHDKAESLYQTVVEDFPTILGWGPTFNQEWITAVRCLQTALTHSQKDHGGLLERVSRLLEQSEELRIAQSLAAP